MEHTKVGILRAACLALIAMLPVVAEACPATIAPEVVCTRFDRKIAVPKLVTQTVEVVHFFNYGCRSCQVAGGAMDFWRKSLHTNVGYVPATAYLSSMPKLEEFNDRTGDFRRGFATLFHVMASLGIQDHAAILDVAASTRSGAQVLPRVAARLGIRESDIHSAAQSAAFAESYRRGLEMQRQFGAMGAPFFVVDRKYAVYPEGTADVREANVAALMLVGQISASLAEASAGNRATVAYFSDWESLAMDTRRRSCDRSVKPVAPDAAADPQALFDTEQMLNGCLAVGSVGALAAAARLSCESANRQIAANREHEAISNARRCHAYANHGLRNVDYLRRGGSAAGAQEFGRHLQELAEVGASLAARSSKAMSLAASKSESLKAHLDRRAALDIRLGELCKQQITVLRTLPTSEVYEYLFDKGTADLLDTCSQGGHDAMELLVSRDSQA